MCCFFWLQGYTHVVFLVSCARRSRRQTLSGLAGSRELLRPQRPLPQRLQGPSSSPGD